MEWKLAPLHLSGAENVCGVDEFYGGHEWGFLPVIVGDFYEVGNIDFFYNCFVLRAEG